MPGLIVKTCGIIVSDVVAAILGVVVRGIVNGRNAFANTPQREIIFRLSQKDE